MSASPSENRSGVAPAARPVETGADLAGYRHRRYAFSFTDAGTPVALPGAGGWLLKRPIPKTGWFDAMGCYPIFACRHWDRLDADLSAIESDCVSVTLVTDPFGAYNEDVLKRCFPDLVVPFKRHHIADLSQPAAHFVSRHHRRYAHKALESVAVQVEPAPARLLDAWCRMYAHLIQRHQIRGMATFSRRTFATMMTVPGLTALLATGGGEILGIQLWFTQGPVAYYHLGASSPAGYDRRAAFALFWTAIEHFARRGLSWLSLGAGAGLENRCIDGLNRFKAGWANDTRLVYLCGRILDRRRYEKLTADRGGAGRSYFPAYRWDDFGSAATKMTSSCNRR